MLKGILLIIIIILLGFSLVLSKKIRKKYRKNFRVFIYFLIFGLFYLGIDIGSSYYIKEYKSNELDSLNKEVLNLENNNKTLKEDLVKYKENKKEIDAKVLNDFILEYENLVKENNKLNDTLEDLINKNNELTKEYEKLYDKTSYRLDYDLTYHQYPSYPNGCESVALYLLLKYYDVDVTVEEIVEKLAKGSSPFYSNGVRYGGNPLREFVGDPRLYNGYGVYEKPIIDVANQFKPGIINYTGASLKEVLAKVGEGRPVQVWGSINMRDTKVCASWLDEKTHEKVDWICNLHSLVIIGYDYKTVITTDSYTGKIESYDRSQFEKMYNLFGKRAIYYE